MKGFIASMKFLPNLFRNNRAWAEGKLQQDPNFFKALCDIQQPEYLWIGCSDSRVPANEITGLAPGEMFVHRNVANLFSSDDLNAVAVLEYAVNVLQVKHIIVCGHYRCGGVKAALTGGSKGAINEWLQPLISISQQHQAELDSLEDDDSKWRRLCEISVVEQVKSLAVNKTVREAWQRKQPLAIHGWIYALSDGLLRDIGTTLAGDFFEA